VWISNYDDCKKTFPIRKILNVSNEASFIIIIRIKPSKNERNLKTSPPMHYSTDQATHVGGLSINKLFNHMTQVFHILPIMYIHIFFISILV